MRIAAFGFRTIPPAKGAAGADKFAMELFPRLVARGHRVVAYNRQYPDVFVDVKVYKGVQIKTIKTIKLRVPRPFIPLPVYSILTDKNPFSAKT